MKIQNLYYAYDRLHLPSATPHRPLGSGTVRIGRRRPTYLEAKGVQLDYTRA
jgi:hypothetical protein